MRILHGEETDHTKFIEGDTLQKFYEVVRSTTKTHFDAPVFKVGDRVEYYPSQADDAKSSKMREAVIVE